MTTCLNCKTAFQTSIYKKYCSTSCYQITYRKNHPKKRVTKYCKYCKHIISNIKSRRYCSAKCRKTGYYKHNRNKILKNKKIYHIANRLHILSQHDKYRASTNYKNKAKKYGKKWRNKHKNYCRLYDLNRREKRLIRITTYYKFDKLKICNWCGSHTTTYWHHPNHDDIFAIEICKPCHIELHKEIRREHWRCVIPS